MPGMETANFQFEHPEGMVYGTLTPQGLAQLSLPYTGRDEVSVDIDTGQTLYTPLTEALDRYFGGAREAFDGIPLDLGSGTAFQQLVWEAACETPWGETQSYGALTEQLGKVPGTARAVGVALGANPIAIVVPCHRFIAQDGSLVNFAAGLAWKQALLRLEGSILC